MEGVNERRLRNVYDAIDLGNNKKALQEVEKVLKKTPNLRTGIALKALALVRLGKEKESTVLMDELEKEYPDEESTLQVMTYWYRETDQLDKICSVYHHAAKKQPANEDLLSQLFMAHVRVNDYKSQQTVALQLYKAKPKNPYYFWAVMSVVLQALRGPESKNKDKSKVLLTLAQRMIDKIIDGGKLDAEQEVQLYLNILEYQEKYDEALKFLESTTCTTFFPGAPISIKIELLKKLNHWTKLREIIKELLLEDPDRWDYQQDYLLACFELLKTDDKNEESVESCFNFICELIESSNKKVRGPYLARLELHKRMRDNQMNADELLGDYLDLLVEYFHIFGDKKCCANDLKLYLEHLEVNRRPGLASKLIQDSGISSTTLPQNKNQLQKHICSLQISRLCGAHSALTAEHLQALYSALSLHYEHSFSAFGDNLLSTDIGPSDQYTLLAAHVMYDLAVKTDSADRLVETLHLLNYLLNNSPSNFHAKLLCLQIFNILGCSLGAHKIHESLEIKHIQLDSMGYLHCSHLPISGIPSLTKPLYDQTLKFFTASYKESLEYLAMSYKFGSFSKLQEFMDFREKISNSLHYSLVSVEALILEIVCMNGTNQQNLLQFQNMKIEPNEDRTKYEELTDNRDLDVVVRWDPTFQYAKMTGEIIKDPVPIHQKIKESEKECFVQDTELLQMRSHLLRLVAASVELIQEPYSGVAKEQVNGNSSSSSISDKDDSFNLLIESWQELFNRVRKFNYQPLSGEFLVNLLPSRLHRMLQLPYDNVFTVLSKFVFNLWIGNDNTKQFADGLTKSLETLKVQVTGLKAMNVNQGIWNFRDLQAVLVGCIEILSLCSFVLSSCVEKYNQSQTQSSSKKQRKASNGGTNHVTAGSLTGKERVALLKEILKEVKVCFNATESALEKLQPIKIEKTLNEYLATMSITPKPTQSNETATAITTVDIDVHTIFTENYQQTTKELTALIKDKLKMIK